MKIVRFKENNGNENWGILNNNQIVKLKKSPFYEIIRSKRIFDIDDVKILPPTKPTKIIGLGLNFKDTYPEGNYPSEPIWFLKGANTLIGDHDKIIYPENIAYAWTEAELAIVIGKETKNIDPEDAKNSIFGYTIGNDLTAENLYGRDHHLARSKSIDTFAPLGPHIETEIDPSDLRIQTWLNGQKIQDTTTANRVYSDSEIISQISKLITLYPGDVILTGTAPGKGSTHIMKAGVIKRGDKIKIEIEGIGILENQVS